MIGLNVVVLVGEVLEDPEQNSKVWKFRIKVSEPYVGRSKSGVMDSYHTIVSWGDRPPNCRKGDAVKVVGSLKCRIAEIEGAKRTFWEISADRVALLFKAEEASAQPQKPEENIPTTGEDDLPF